MNEYPRMLYGESGATMIVQTPEQHEAAGPAWASEPSDLPSAPVTDAPPPLQSGQEAMIEAIAARTAEVVLAALKALPPPPDEASANAEGVSQIPPPAPAKRGTKMAMPEQPTESGE